MEQHSSTPPALPRNAPTATWSLVLGILSITCFSIFTGIPAVICGHKALGAVKRSGGALTGSGLALAGLITGYLSFAILLIVVPMMMAIAIPNFVRARETAMKYGCITNLRFIEGAVHAWSVENKKPDDAVVTFDDIKPYLQSQLVCPKGGVYKLGTVKDKPTCSIPGHVLPGD